MVNLTCHPSWRWFDFSSSILSFQLKMEWSCLAFEWTCLKSCWWQIWRVNSHQVVDCSPTRNMKLYLSRGHFSLSPFTCLLSACIACYNPLPVIPSLDVGWNWYFNREENWARANLHLQGCSNRPAQQASEPAWNLKWDSFALSFYKNVGKYVAIFHNFNIFFCKSHSFLGGNSKSTWTIVYR